MFTREPPPSGCLRQISSNGARPAMGRGLIHRGTRGASGAACSDDEQCGNTSLSKTLLPPTAADLRHLLDRAIPRARPWSPSRHTCRFVWGHHDGRAPCRGRIVERDCVVDRDAGAVGVERRDQAAAGCRVICRRLRPRVGHDILRGGSARWCLCPPATRTAFPCIVQDLECPPGERHAVIPLRQLRRPSMCSVKGGPKLDQSGGGKLDHPAARWRV